MNEIDEQAQELLKAINKFIEIADEKLMPVDIDYLNGFEPRIKRIINNPK